MLAGVCVGAVVAVAALLCAVAALHRALDRNADVRAALDEARCAGEVVLVTGGSAGLGLCFAERFCRRGFQVVLVARNAEKLRDAAAQLAPLAAHPVLTISCDLSSPDATEQRILPFLAEHRLRVGVLVNNAGLGYAGRLHLQRPAPLRRLVAVNCAAPTELACALAAGMVERQRGAILMVSSVSAYQPLPTHAAYAASKAFLSTLSFSLWEELRPHRVHVLAVEPGTVVTGFAEAAGQAPHHGASPDDVVDDAMRALDAGRASTVYGWYVWARACAASLLPRVLVAPIARRKMEPLDMNTKGA